MLKWAAIFLVISILAGLLGFKIIAGVAASLAKVFLLIFLILLLLFVIRGISGYRRINR